MNDLRCSSERRNGDGPWALALDAVRDSREGGRPAGLDPGGANGVRDVRERAGPGGTGPPALGCVLFKPSPQPRALGLAGSACCRPPTMRSSCALQSCVRRPQGPGFVLHNLRSAPHRLSERCVSSSIDKPSREFAVPYLPEVARLHKACATGDAAAAAVLLDAAPGLLNKPDIDLCAPGRLRDALQQVG